MEKINVHKERLGIFLIEKFNIKNSSLKKILKGTIHYTETLGTALILVLVIQRFYLGNFMVPTGSMLPVIVPKDRLFGNMVIYKFSKPKREDIVVFKEPIQNKVLYTKRAMGLPGEEVEIKDGKLYINDVAIKTRGYTDLGEIRGKKWIVPKKGDKLIITPLGNYDDMYKANNIDIAKVQKYLSENPGAVSEILPDLKFEINGMETGMLLDMIHNKKIVDDLFAGKTVDLVIDKDYYLTLGDNTEGSYDSRMWGFVPADRIRGKAFVRFWPLNRISLLK
ncbi:MAG: signal peptidase I [Fusobacteriaceae bacterium]